VTRWAKQLLCTSEEVDALDGGKAFTNIKSHLNVALLEMEDGSLSVSCNERSVLLEEYLQARWSRSSSFD
jgi:ethanolamine utilization microcompartment shell protein EutL